MCVVIHTPASNDPGPVVTQEEIDSWTKLWQKRLDLVDWRIGTMIVRQTELKPETLGNLHWDTSLRPQTPRRTRQIGKHEHEPADLQNRSLIALYDSLVHKVGHQAGEK
jgi:hypothetical protein